MDTVLHNAKIDERSTLTQAEINLLALVSYKTSKIDISI